MTKGPYVPLAIADRSGRDESIHFGGLVVLDRAGAVSMSMGDPSVEIYPRSSLKPLQAWAMLAAGLDLPDDLLALVCASHDGRPMHIDGVRQILRSAGLDESALMNTADLPLAQDEAERVLSDGGTRTSIQQNCSGKHAGMLATCRANDWPLDSYLDGGHPLQQSIAAGIAHLSGRGVAHIGIDGCGAPTHMMQLVDLARAFRSIAMGDPGSSGERIARAMSSHPEMVGGPGHTTTMIMRGLPGLMLKDGAEGVAAGAFADGRAFALKIADGSNRARPPVIGAALRAMAADISAIDDRVFAPEVLGHGRPVGRVRCVEELAALGQSQ